MSLVRRGRETWQSWGADAWVVQVLRFGYRVPFLSRHPLSSIPLPLPSYNPSSIRGLAFADAVSDRVAKAAIEPAPPTPGYYSRLFVTPKVTGGWLPVIDLSRFNGFVDVSHFHMETTQSVFQSLRVGDWMVCLDLQDAYLQVPVHPSSRRYLRFCVEGSIFQFRALCFGLSTAPQVFTRVMAPVSAIMHRHWFQILRYLDDWLVLASTFQEIARARDFLLWLCHQLGIRVNLPKSSLDPSQTQDYLGMTIQTSPLRVFPTFKQVQKCLYSFRIFFPRVHPVSIWHQLLGVMSSMSALVPGARLHMRSLQLRLSVSGPLLSEEALVSWDSDCHPDLLWWSDVSHLQAGLPLGEDLPDLFLFTDASDTGWGASLGDAHLQLVVSPVLPIFHQSPGAPCRSFRDPRVPSFSPWSCGGGVLRQHHSPGVPQETGWHSIFHYQRGGSDGSPPVRGLSSSTPSPVHSGQVECPRGFPEPQDPSHQLRVDPLFRGFLSASSPVASHHRSLRYIPQLPSPGVLFANGGSSVGGHRCHAPELERSSGLCLPSIRPHLLAKVRQSWGLELTLVAPFWPQHPWFLDLL